LWPENDIQNFLDRKRDKKRGAVATPREATQRYQKEVFSYSCKSFHSRAQLPQMLASVSGRAPTVATGNLDGG
jgi:hypothetical protein